MKETDLPLNHDDTENNKNYRGQNDGSLSYINLLDVLDKAGMKEEYERFKKQAQRETYPSGTYLILKEMKRLFKTYPELRKKFDKTQISQLYDSKEELNDKPFDHGDMGNIRNYSGKNAKYPNSIPNILHELGMKEELKQFDEAIRKGTFSIVDEIMRLVTDYPTVRGQFRKDSLEIISSLWLKMRTCSLNEIIRDSKDNSEHELQNKIADKTAKSPEEVLQRKENETNLQKMAELCKMFFEKEFPDEQEYIRRIKEKDPKELFKELLVYAEKGGHNTASDLFREYRELSDIPDDRFIGPIHTRFAKKIRHIFDNAKADPTIRRIYDEIK